MQAARQRKKQQHKRVIVESTHRRPPRLLLKQDATLHGHLGARVRSGNASKPQHPRQTKSEASPQQVEDATPQTLNGYFKKVARQFVRRETQRPEGWAAAKINHAMEKYHAMQMLGSRRKPKHLYAQSKKLFEECCKCRPLVQGPVMSEDGILRLAGPNLPKILRILQSKESDGLDLMQPHGLDQYAGDTDGQHRRAIPTKSFREYALTGARRSMSRRSEGTRSSCASSLHTGRPTRSSLRTKVTASYCCAAYWT